MIKIRNFSKSMAFLICLLMTLSILQALIPTTKSQTSGQMGSFAYLIVEPNPVGVGQTTYIAMMIDVPLPAHQKPTTLEDMTTNLLSLHQTVQYRNKNMGKSCRHNRCPINIIHTRSSRNLQLYLHLSRPKIHMDHRTRRKRSIRKRNLPRHQCNSNPNSPTRPSSCNSQTHHYQLNTGQDQSTEKTPTGTQSDHTG